MFYAGYTARLEFDADKKTFIGRVKATRPETIFFGSSVEELERAFQAAIDAYIMMCQQEGCRLEREHSGKLSVRMTPELHGEIKRAADMVGMSVNRWIVTVAANALENPSDVAET